MIDLNTAPDEQFETAGKKDAEQPQQETQAAAEPEVVAAEPTKEPEPAAPQDNKQVAAKPKLAAIPADENGVIVGATFEDQYRLAKVYAASGLLPAAFKTPEQIFTALQFMHELGIRGITGIRNVCVINGTPSLWGDLPLALVKRSNKIKAIKEWLVNDKGEEISAEKGNIKDKVYAAYCRTERADGTVVTTWFSEEDAKSANLLGNQKKPIWNMYKRRMLQMRARGQNLKDNFGDVLMGSSIAEYDHNAIIDNGGKVLEQDNPETPSAAKTLNEKFLAAKDVSQTQEA